VNAPITNTLYRRVEISPEAAAAALGHIDPLQPLSGALTALGLTDRVSVRRTELPAPTADQPLSLTLTWRLANANQAQVVWTLAVSPTGDGDSLLSTTIQARGDHPTADPQLLAAWPLLQPIIHSHTTRLLGAVTALGEQLEEIDLNDTSTPLEAAA
jgi:hypothetical protein